METKTIKVGIVGVGGRGEQLFKPLKNIPGAEPVAICDFKDEMIDRALKYLGEGFENIKRYSSYEEMLKSDIDAVIVATDPDSHAKLSMQALDAGKHVLSEIPALVSEEEAKLLKAAVKRSSAKYMVAENCCFWAHIDAYKKMYDEGVLGDVLYAEAEYLHPCKALLDPEEANRPKTWRSYLPAIHYLTHSLGPILYILEDRVAEVSGFVPDKNPVEEAHPGPPNGLAIIKTKKGVLIKIFIGFGINHIHGSMHHYLLYGTKGCVQTARGNSADQGKSVGCFSHTPYLKGYVDIPVYYDYPGKGAGTHGGADPIMVEEWIRCIRANEEPKLGIDYAIDISIPGILADISSKEHGKMMQMPFFE